MALGKARLAQRELEKHLALSQVTEHPVTSVREAARLVDEAVALERLIHADNPGLGAVEGETDFTGWTDDEILRWREFLQEVEIRRRMGPGNGGP